MAREIVTTVINLLRQMPNACNSLQHHGGRIWALSEFSSRGALITSFAHLSECVTDQSEDK